MVGAGLESGLCQARIARMLGRCPSVIRGEIKRNADADGCYRGGEAGAWPHVGAPVPRSAPSMPPLFCGPVPGPASPGAERPARSAGASRPGARGGGGAPCAGSPVADGRTISREAIYTWIHTPSRRRGLVEHGIVLASLRWDAQKWAPLRWVVSLPGRGDAVDRAGALASTTARYPAAWEDAA